MAPVTHERLPLAEFAFPGPQRDALVSAVLSGQKVATTSLLLEYKLSGEPLPVPGQLSIVVDSTNRPVAVIETTSVSVVRLGDVGARHAADEGEGYTLSPNGGPDMRSSGRATRCGKRSVTPHSGSTRTRLLSSSAFTSLID